MPSNDKTEKEDDRKRKELDLEWKDYIAITIALLETIFLPFVLLIAVLVIVTLILLFFV